MIPGVISSYGREEAAPTAAPIRTYLTGSADNGGSAATRTYAGVNFGTAAPDRYLLFCHAANHSTNCQATAVTIGGVAATLVASVANTNGTTRAATMWIANVPTGTSGDIVVTYGGGSTGAAYHLYHITGLQSPVPHDTSSATAEPANMALDVPANGFIIGMIRLHNTDGPTWTGLTVDGIERVYDSCGVTVASKDFATVQSNYAFSASRTGSSANRACAVSFE